MPQFTCQFCDYTAKSPAWVTRHVRAAHNGQVVEGDVLRQAAIPVDEQPTPEEEPVVDEQPTPEEPAAPAQPKERPFFFIAYTVREREQLAVGGEAFDIVATVGKREGYRHIANVREVAHTSVAKMLDIHTGTLVIVEVPAEEAESAARGFINGFPIREVL